MTKYKFDTVQVATNFSYGNATTIDYQGLSFIDNNLSNPCVNLAYHFEQTGASGQVVSISNLPDNIVNCYGTFQNSYHLTHVDKVPASVVNMSYAFRNCYNLTTTPNMSNCTNVTDMSYAFYYCNNITEAPDLTNCTNLTNIYRCFAYDYALRTAPVIPNSVTNICNILQGCTNITAFPTIPNTITNLDYSFEQCRNVTTVGYNISSEVTSMNHTFARCEGLKGNIFIESNKITSAVSCFANTTVNKNVYIPYTYANGTESATHAAFIAAGYDEAGTSCGVNLKDIATYVPPVKYDFSDANGSTRTFSWSKDLSTPVSADCDDVTSVTCDGITYGANCSLGTTSMNDRLTIAHTTNNEAAPGDESYVGFLFNVTKGMFKPKVLSFNVSKNGTSGGSVMVTMKFNSSEEVTVATLPTIARNSETPSYTDTTIDLTQFDMGASKGTVMIKFYLYNQGSTKTFSLFNVSLQGLLKNGSHIEIV